MAKRKQKVVLCPATEFQRITGGRHKLRILWELREGPLRYAELRRAVGRTGAVPVVDRVLSRELKSLAANELIRRKPYPTVPPKVEYRLSPLGEKLVPVIAVICGWVKRHVF